MFDDLLEKPAPTVTPAPRKTETEQERCIIAQALVIQVFLKTIAGDSHWTNRLAALLAEHPDVPARARGLLFQRVLENSIHVQPAPYRKLIARKA